MAPSRSKDSPSVPPGNTQCLGCVPEGKIIRDDILETYPTTSSLAYA
jgi:hypothetical protein